MAGFNSSTFRFASQNPPPVLFSKIKISVMQPATSSATNTIIKKDHNFCRRRRAFGKSEKNISPRSSFITVKFK